MANNNNSDGLPLYRSQSSDNSSRSLSMTHNSTIPLAIPSFQRRTADSARQLRDNFNNVIREIQPLVDTARAVNAGVQSSISITSFLNRSHSTPSTESASSSHQNNAEVSNSFVISLDDVSPESDDADNSNDELELHNEAPNANNNGEDPNNHDGTVLEAQRFLQVIVKYVPFMLILLAKSVYDYHETIFILIILLATFVHTNSTVKKETTKRHRRSLKALGVELLYIFACGVFVHYIFSGEGQENFNIVLNLVLIRTFTHPFTVGTLLWIVTITDFLLKLFTVGLKILLTMLPGQVIAFQKRGKVYLFIEAVSQMYRSIATIQPWLNYLLESYQGPEKIVAVFLSAFYMISKGADLMSRMKLLKTAFWKLLQNVTVGSSPSKEQIQTAGEHCPICHDQYDCPVLLQCRHIFCESCVTTWFDREQTCPLCRAKIVDDPSWRDGSTSYFIQLY